MAKITEEKLLNELKKFIKTDSNIVVSDTANSEFMNLYHRINQYAIREYNANFKFFLETHGLNYERGLNNRKIAIERHFEEIQKRTIPGTDKVFIRGTDPLYKALNTYIWSHKLISDELEVTEDCAVTVYLRKLGFERITLSQLPSSYNPPDFSKKNLLKGTDKVKTKRKGSSNKKYDFIPSNIYISIEDILEVLEKKNTEDILKRLKLIQNDLKKQSVTQLKIQRSRQLVIELKGLYKNKCQLCSWDNPEIPRIIKKDGEPYSEVHHIKPMCSWEDTNDNLDNYQNALCVCPYHHALLHHGSYIFNKLIEINRAFYLVSEDDSFNIQIKTNLHIN